MTEETLRAQTEQLFNSFLGISRLDCCSALLAGRPASMTLPMIQNADLYSIRQRELATESLAIEIHHPVINLEQQQTSCCRNPILSLLTTSLSCFWRSKMIFSSSFSWVFLSSSISTVSCVLRHKALTV